MSKEIDEEAKFQTIEHHLQEIEYGTANLSDMKNDIYDIKELLKKILIELKKN
jgi:hypothetical protein